MAGATCSTAEFTSFHKYLAIGAVASIIPAQRARGRRGRLRVCLIDRPPELQRVVDGCRAVVPATVRRSTKTLTSWNNSPPSSSSGVHSASSRRSSASSATGSAVRCHRSSVKNAPGNLPPAPRTRTNHKNSTRTKRSLPHKRSIDSGELSSSSSVLLEKRRSSFTRKRNNRCSMAADSSNCVNGNRALLDGFSIDTSRAKTNLDVVSLCARRLRMTEYTEPTLTACDVYWYSAAPSDLRTAVRGGARARINRLPGAGQTARKVALTHAVRSLARLFPDAYAFYPKSWALPSQLDEFRSHCAAVEGGDLPAGQFSFSGLLARRFSSAGQLYYIVKPDDGAQGAGIYLMQSPAGLRGDALTCRQLVQEYVASPYLLGDGLKFDLRVYGVVRSLNPLSIYVAREGMARFCTAPYRPPTADNLDDLYSHLTNYSLNKANGAYVHSTTLRQQTQGSKRLMSTVFHQMEAHGCDTRRLWREIKRIVVRTVLAMVPDLMLHHEQFFAGGEAPQCFQIFGFDIIVRSDGTPLLLEVNAAPSLSIRHQTEGRSSTLPSLGPSSAVVAQQPAVAQPIRSIVDEMIKIPLVHDCLLLVTNRLTGEYPDNACTNSCRDQDHRETSDGKLPSTPVQDDLGVLRCRRRPHLTQVFPGREAAAGADRQLLVLDRAVYLFMQFVSVRHTLMMTLNAFRDFLRKCNLTEYLHGVELDELFEHLHLKFSTGRQADTDSTLGLPFHGFLDILFRVAHRKFSMCEDDLAAFLRLLAYCDSTLRYSGVRSTRLRHAEVSCIDTENRANTTEIYLLPNRMRQDYTQRHGANRRPDAVVVTSQRQLRSRSLPPAR